MTLRPRSVKKRDVCMYVFTYVCMLAFAHVCTCTYDVLLAKVHVCMYVRTYVHARKSHISNIKLLTTY